MPIFLILLFLALFPGPIWAEAVPGAYRASPSRVDIDVLSWGTDCGPEPGPESVPAAEYELVEGSLRPARGARPLFSDGICKAVTGLGDLVEVRAEGRVRCKAKESAGKRVDATLTLTQLGEAQLKVRHEIEYEWRFKGSHCHVRQRASFALARRDSVPKAVSPPTIPPPASRCATPGPIARLTPVGSTRRAITAGGKLRLGVLGQDANGCSVALPAARWSTSQGKLYPVGRGQALLDTADVLPGEPVQVLVSAGTLSVRFEVQLAGTAADLAALVAAEPELVESELPPVPMVEGEGLSGRAEAVTPEAVALSFELVMGLGVGIVALLVGVALVVVRRARALKQAPIAPEALAKMEQVSLRPRAKPIVRAEVPPAEPISRTESPVKPVSPYGRQCPVCERIFDAGTHFCPFDGVALDEDRVSDAEPESPGRQCPRCGALFPPTALHCPHDGALLVAPGQAALRARICPRCGATYPLDTRFCGLDGEELVLLN